MGVICPRGVPTWHLSLQWNPSTKEAAQHKIKEPVTITKPENFHKNLIFIISSQFFHIPFYRLLEKGHCDPCFSRKIFDCCNVLMLALVKIENYTRSIDFPGGLRRKEKSKIANFFIKNPLAMLN